MNEAGSERFSRAFVVQGRVMLRIGGGTESTWMDGMLKPVLPDF